MRTEDMQMTRGIPLFRAMSNDTFGRLMAVSFIQTFPAGVILLEQGQQPDFLFLLLEGSVELAASHGNSEGAICIVPPGQPFTTSAVLTDQPTLSQARTIGTCRAVMMPAAAVREALASDHGFCHAMVLEIAQINRMLVREINNQKLRNSTERLANWVLHAHVMSAGSDPIRLPFRKRTLAALLGMTPENLSRTIASLEPHGVSFRGAVIAVTDPDALRRVARPTQLIDAH
ncbi:cyclic nucleotide-binding domain-containing protein [Alsobacter sp. R-9]